MLSQSPSRRFFRTAFAVACGTLLSGSALAAEDGISVERLRLATDRSGIVSVEGGRVHDHLHWDAGAWLGFAKDPLVIYRVSDAERVNALVGNRMGGSLIASVGLFGRAQVAFELPLVLSQDGHPNVVLGEGVRLDGAAIGNLRVVPKLQLLRAEEHGLDVAVGTGVSIPLGSTSSFAGSPDVEVTPHAAASRSFGNVRAAATVGATLRRTRGIENVEFGREISAEAGVAYRLRRVGLPLELQGVLAGGFSGSRPFARENETPAELRAAAAYDVTRAVQLVAGGGVGLTSGWGTPSWRTLLAVRVARAAQSPAKVAERPVVEPPPVPEPPLPPAPVVAVRADRDGDGIVDDSDRCADDPETPNGFEDEDGCPDILDTDRDGDHVVDRVDECPDVPGDLASSGCPTAGAVKLSGAEIEVEGTIYFDTDKATIQERSFSLIDAVAAVIRAHPEIRIRVEGHTDNRGSRAHNMSLSDRRARAVVARLTAAGISADRLAAEGFGFSRPVSPNDTAAGRTLNRRVEFHVISDDAATGGARAVASPDTEKRSDR